MKKRILDILLAFLILAFSLPACSGMAVQPTAILDTKTPVSTMTKTVKPTNTPRPSATPRPTRTPNLTATQKYEEVNTEAQKYFDLATVHGRYVEFDDFHENWAQLGWYNRWEFEEKASNFYLTAHFKWSSAYRNADISGCGFAFAIQDNGDHYALFLDKSKVLFVKTDYYYYPIGPTHGTGRVSFGNPFDKPDEADLTLVVKDTQAYVLVNGESVGEYALAKSRNLRGKLGYTLLSGTNKGYGTRCEITNTHGWIAK